MLCEKCEIEHDGTYGSGRFCSRKCAHNRKHLKETVDYNKISETLKARFASRSFEECGWDSKRERVISEQDGKCAHCGLSEWRGFQLSLEVDHINGDNSDDSRSNLEALCPNCHSLTETWRGRNKETTRKKLTDDELLAILKNSPNIRQGLLKAGFAAKGSNYNRAKRLLEKSSII